MYNPPHPGQVLRDFLGNASVTEAALAMRISRAALSRILNGNTGISPDMAYRVGAVTGTTPELWAGMQMQYDLWKARLLKRPTLKRMLASFDPAIHGGEFMPGAPAGKEAFAEGSERPKRPAKA
jgi:addiction module HigA family antidote